MKINTQGFYGIVILKDWMLMPDDDNYLGIEGIIYIFENKKLVKFDATNREANFIVRVQNKNNTNSINIFGCQIRSIIQTNNKTKSKKYFRIEDYYEME